MKDMKDMMIGRLGLMIERKGSYLHNAPFWARDGDGLLKVNLIRRPVGYTSLPASSIDAASIVEEAKDEGANLEELEELYLWLQDPEHEKEKER